MRSPFLSRHFVLLWQGQVVSHLGNQAFLIAVTFHIVEATGSATLVASALIAATAPLVILAPVAGSIADRHSRRTVLIASDVSRALAVGALGAALLRAPDVASHYIALMVLIAAFNGVMSAIFMPAFQALVPDLVPASQLPAANAFSQMSRQAATLTGQALGGLLYVAWGPARLLLFDAITFAYAGAATWLIPPDRCLPRRRATIRAAIAQFAADTRESLGYVWRNAGMTPVLVVFAGVNCFFMPVIVLLPFYTREVLHAGPEWYGFLLAGSGGGALAGSLAAGMAVVPVRSAATLVRSCLAGIAAAIQLLALARSTWLALGACAAIGACSSIVNVVVITAFQSSVPAAMRGRVMALVIALSTAAVPIGMGVGGTIGELWRGSPSVLIAGCGAAIAALTGVSCTSRAFGKMLASVAVLRGTGR